MWRSVCRQRAVEDGRNEEGRIHGWNVPPVEAESEAIDLYYTREREFEHRYCPPEVTREGTN